MQRMLVCLGVLATLWMSCDTGTPFANRPPETSIFVDTLNLIEDDLRLNTVVQLHWLGEDSDGYIKGYEIAIDESDWAFVTTTDSIFRFDIPMGLENSDIYFQVRAVDNEDQVDPSPAELYIPIKNTPPTVRFDTINLLPDTVRSVWSNVWSIDDRDGVETLDSVFIRINEGPWRGFSPGVNFMTFVPESPDVEGEQHALLYAGTEAVFSEIPLAGLRVGDSNRVYVQARDISGSVSELDSTPSFFLAPISSDLLVIEEHRESAPGMLYQDMLNAEDISYDWYNLKENVPDFWEPTFALYLQLYDKVFWFSDGSIDPALGEDLLLSIAGGPLQTFLNQGGKLLATSPFPSSYNNPVISQSSLIFDFSPMDSLSSSAGQARVGTNAKVVPVGEWGVRFDTLIASAFITSADPYYSKNPDNDMFEAELTVSGGWEGPTTIGGRTRFSNGRTNQVFFSVELHKLNQDEEALKKLITTILEEEFAW